MPAFTINPASSNSHQLITQALTIACFDFFTDESNDTNAAPGINVICSEEYLSKLKCYYSFTYFEIK